MKTLDRNSGWASTPQLGIGVRQEFVDVLSPKLKVTPELNPIPKLEKARWVQGEAAVDEVDPWLSPPTEAEPSVHSTNAMLQAFSRILSKGSVSLPMDAASSGLGPGVEKEQRMLRLLSERLERRQQIQAAGQERTWSPSNKR